MKRRDFGKMILAAAGGILASTAAAKAGTQGGLTSSGADGKSSCNAEKGDKATCKGDKAKCEAAYKSAITLATD